MIIQFPTRQAAPALRQITSFTDLAQTDADLEARAAELLPRAMETIHQFSPHMVAEMLAYNAARLERIGFKVFRN